MILIAGNSNRPLAEAVARSLNVDLADVSIKRFADQEIFVELKRSVRGEDVFIIQSTSFPANDHLMELLILIDAVKRDSARRITAVLPYFGYARQDRLTAPRTPISAKLVANIIAAAGANRVITFEFHSEQIEGFFDLPIENLFVSQFFAQDILSHFNVKNLLMVSPDVGGLRRARAIAMRLEVDTAVVDKRREKPGLVQALQIIGDVANKECVIIDDIVDSGGTLCTAASALKDAGAKLIKAYVIHGVLSCDAIKKIENSEIDELVITDTILARPEILNSPKIRRISIADFLSEAIERLSKEQPLSPLYT
jgi:ribose-phosphate pyrophosphokinase